MTEDTLTALERSTDVLRRSQRQLDALRRENARLRDEANRLRRRLAPPRHHRIVDRTLEDATLIMHYRHAGMEVSRRWLDACGIMTERRYGWAVALLRLARLEHVTPGSIEHLDKCLRRLELTAERLRQDNDLTALRVRGNSKIRLGH